MVRTMTFKSLVAKCTRQSMSAVPHILSVPLLSAVVLLFSASSAIGAPRPLQIDFSCQQLLTARDNGPSDFQTYHDSYFLPFCELRVRTFRDKFLRIPRDSQTESIFIETQVKLQRVLNYQEIRELLPKILLVTGDQLEKSE
jgi:hypothetical protein